MGAIVGVFCSRLMKLERGFRFELEDEMWFQGKKQVGAGEGFIIEDLIAGPGRVGLDCLVMLS